MDDDFSLLDEVSSLADDLEQAPWVEWGLWGDDCQTTGLCVKAGEFDVPDSQYLENNEPQQTPAVRLQLALRQFLGQD